MTEDRKPAVLEHAPSNLLDALIEGCQVIGFDWAYLYLNSAAAQHGRRPANELLGRTMMDVYPGIEATPMFALLRKCMTERSAQRMENEFEFPDGSKGWFELRMEPVPQGVFILSLDITDRKRNEQEVLLLQRQFHQAQKMEAIGQLAGGVAHDFNNLLSLVIGYTDVILQSLNENDPLRSDVVEIRRAGERATALTRQLLAISRNQPSLQEVVAVNPIVKSTDAMLHRVLGEGIQLVTSLAATEIHVRLGVGQLDQILMNLAINARDAMPTGGTLTIETAVVDLDAEYARKHFDVKPGRYAVIAVSDTGVGMTDDVQARAFEPFFTTKESSRGTGLGLATVYGIVKQGGGWIWLYSEVGVGTTCKIYFPIVYADEQNAAPEQRPVKPASGETILLVEDEPGVRSITQRLLTSSGYKVITAEGGKEAIALCHEHRASLKLMLTDVMMPGMSGVELAAQAAKLCPNLKVMYMSGYAENAVNNVHALGGKVRFISKPFSAADLTRKVREALDEEGPKAEH